MAPPKIRWTFRMKECLDVIVDDGLEWKDVAAVFNVLFAEYLSGHCRLPNGASPRSLYAQHNERRKMAGDWGMICALPRDDITLERRAKWREKIQNAATSLTLSNGSKTLLHGKSNARGKRKQRNVLTTKKMKKSSLEKGLQFLTQDTKQPWARKQPRDTVVHESAFFKQFMAGAADAALSCQDDNDDDDDGDEFSPASKPIARRSNLLKVPYKIQTTKTPPSRESPKVSHLRPDGSTIKISALQKERIHQDLNPIVEKSAHPPSCGLLFRLWVKKEPRDHNSEDGFVARRYFRANVVPNNTPPPSTALDWTDLFNHLNRNKVPSPFISTSNRLVWVIRGALSMMKKGEGDAQITVIDPNFDLRRIFWARPFHNELVKKYCFTNGAQRYAGSTEFLIWKNIPKEACMHTIAVTDLLRFVTCNQVLNEALRFDFLSSWKSLDKKIKELKAQNHVLDTKIAAAIGRLSLFMGLDSRSPTSQLAHIVSNVLEGWGIHVEFETHRTTANAYVEVLCGTSASAGIIERTNAKTAFLDGVRWGLGDFNARCHPEKMQQMARKARRVGLDDPASIIIDELEAAKSAVQAYFQQQKKLIQGNNSNVAAGVESSNEARFAIKRPRATIDSDSDDLMSDDEEEVVIPPPKRVSRILWTKNYENEYEADNNAIATSSRRTTTTIMDGNEILYVSSDDEDSE